jgi:hypothetical protein
MLFVEINCILAFALFNTSTSIAKIVQKGLRTHIGAHDEPPLGLNYHAEMFFTSAGGLSNNTISTEYLRELNYDPRFSVQQRLMLLLLFLAYNHTIFTWISVIWKTC